MPVQVSVYSLLVRGPATSSSKKDSKVNNESSQAMASKSIATPETTWKIVYSPEGLKRGEAEDQEEKQKRQQEAEAKRVV